MEETVHSAEVPQLHSTPGSNVAYNVGKRSRADYTCYSLNDSAGRMVAVIIETKMSVRSDDVVAQVSKRQQSSGTQLKSRFLKLWTWVTVFLKPYVIIREIFGRVAIHSYFTHTHTHQIRKCNKYRY